MMLFSGYFLLYVMFYILFYDVIIELFQTKQTLLDLDSTVEEVFQHC